MPIDTVKDLVKSIAEWIAANANRESYFLTANPQWEVNATALLDHICSVTGINQGQVEKWAEAKGDIRCQQADQCKPRTS